MIHLNPKSREYLNPYGKTDEKYIWQAVKMYGLIRGDNY